MKLCLLAETLCANVKIGFDGTTQSLKQYNCFRVHNFCCTHAQNINITHIITLFYKHNLTKRTKRIQT